MPFINKYGNYIAICDECGKKDSAFGRTPGDVRHTLSFFGWTFKPTVRCPECWDKHKHRTRKGKSVDGL